MDVRGATIAVTGATGFLGRYIVELCAAQGARVVGVVRNPDRVPALRRLGIELRRADLSEPEALELGFRGVDVVVANAALFSSTNFVWEDYYRINIEGTGNVLAAAANAGVRRIVQISTAGIYGLRFARLDEDAPLVARETPLNPFSMYPVSKAESERLAWRCAQEWDLALTTLRPSMVYGAFDPYFLSNAAAFKFAPVLPVFLHAPLVYAGDVAEAVLLSIENEASVGRAYNLSGPSVAEFMRAWRELDGMPGPTFEAPVGLRQAIDSSRATRELGWRNRAVRDGLIDTFRREAAEEAESFDSGS